MNVADDLNHLAAYLVENVKPCGDLYLTKREFVAVVALIKDGAERAATLERNVIVTELRGAQRDEIDGDKVVSLDDWRRKRGR